MMNSDMLQSYSALLGSLKENILKNFVKVELKLIDLINSSGSSISLISAEKKHNLNLIIMEILAEYSHINMSMEKINNNIKVAIDKNVQNFSPEREHFEENNICMPLRFQAHTRNPFALNLNPFDTFVENLISNSDILNKNNNDAFKLKEICEASIIPNETLTKSYDDVTENNEIVENNENEMILFEGLNEISDDQVLELNEYRNIDTSDAGSSKALILADNTKTDNEQEIHENKKLAKSPNQTLTDSDFTKIDKYVENAMNKSVEFKTIENHDLDLKEIFKTSKLHTSRTLINSNNTEIDNISSEQENDEYTVGDNLEENKLKEVSSPLIVESALEKLQNMNINDRIAEAMKKFDKEILPENFGFVTTDPNLGTTNVKIKKKRKPHCYQVQDSKLDLNDVCTVICVENPSNFYVTLDTEILFELNAAINEEYNHQAFHVAARHKNKNKAKAELGDYGVAYVLEKHQWFRVEILDWFMAPTTDKLDETVLVRLIDFGEEFLLCYNNIHTLNQIYSHFPKMAIKCHLAELFPFNEQCPNIWSSEAINEFKALTKDQQFIVIHQSKKDDSYAIDLCNVSSNDERSLSQILTEKNLAFDKYEEAQAQENNIFADINGDELEYCENLNEAISGYDAQDEVQTCKFINKHGSCYKGPRCKLKHVKTTSSGITTDTILTIQTTFQEREFPVVGSCISILITECASVTEFYGQIIIGPRSTNVFNKNFDKLFNRMNCEEMKASYVLYKVYPSNGEIVIARYAETYFRARFLQNINDQDFLVFLVDVGTEVRVKFSSIFYMKEEFMFLPIQAFIFRIESCRQKADVDQEKVKNFINKSMNYKHFTACVKTAVEPIVVQLWDLQNMDMSYVLDQMSFIDTNVENVYHSKDSYLQLM